MEELAAVREELTVLKEIHAGILAQNARARRRGILQIATIVLLFAIVCVLIAALRMLSPLTDEVSQTLTLLNQTVEAADLPGLAKDISDFSVQGADAIAKAGAAVETLGSLDVAQLNTSLSELGATISKLSQIDIESLNTAIDNLNQAVGPLARFAARFN